MLIDLAFLTPTLSLFHSFIQYGKNVPLKDFVLVGSGLIIEADENQDKNRGSMVVNDLQFYKKRLIYCANVF